MGVTAAARGKASAGDESTRAPRLGKRERSKLEKRARIEQAARDVFAEKGFAAATTQEISARAGVAAGTLFLYARTKEELLAQAFTADLYRVMDEAERTLPTAAPILQSLLHVFGAMTALHRELGPALSSVLLTVLMARGGADVSPERPRRMGLVEDLLEREARARGVAPPISSVEGAETLLCIFHWLLSHWAYERLTPELMETRMRSRFEIFLKGYFGEV
jgi:AcrR family transcriptional regulator